LSRVGEVARSARVQRRAGPVGRLLDRHEHGRSRRRRRPPGSPRWRSRRRRLAAIASRSRCPWARRPTGRRRRGVREDRTTRASGASPRSTRRRRARRWSSSTAPRPRRDLGVSGAPAQRRAELRGRGRRAEQVRQALLPRDATDETTLGRSGSMPPFEDSVGHQARSSVSMPLCTTADAIRIDAG
jgi:hypothetical protein